MGYPFPDGLPLGSGEFTSPSPHDRAPKLQQRNTRHGPDCPTGKERITIRLDTDVLNYFRDVVERAGGGNYQTLINNALRSYIEGGKKPTLEETFRRVIRQELRAS